MRLIYRIHKWLAVVVAVATVLWFVSGLVMLSPGPWRTLSWNLPIGPDAEGRLPGAPAFEDAAVPVSEAVAAVRTHAGKPAVVTSVRLRRLPGRLAYEVATQGAGTFLVDAVSGSIFTVDGRMAEQIIRRALGPSAALGPAVLQRVGDERCPGPMPVYRMNVGDGKDTAFCVGLLGDVRYTDRRVRLVREITGWHTFEFLRPWGGQTGTRLAGVAFGVIGLLMTLAGIVILWDQFRRWQRNRRRYRRTASAAS